MDRQAGTCSISANNRQNEDDVTCLFLFRNFFTYITDSNAMCSSTLKQSKRLRPVHIRDPINPRSLPLWKNGRIGNERALIGESVGWSKIQRRLVGPAPRGRCERDKFFNRLKNGREWSRSPQVVCWAGIQRCGRRYIVGWSYFDRVWSAIQRK